MLNSVCHLAFKQLLHICFLLWVWPNTTNYKNNIKINSLFYCVLSRISNCFTVGFASLFQKSPYSHNFLWLSVEKEEEGLLELSVALLASGRIQITWENILKVKCPGFEQGTYHLHHFWEPQTSCRTMNLIWKDSGGEGKYSGSMSHQDNEAVAVLSDLRPAERWRVMVLISPLPLKLHYSGQVVQVLHIPFLQKGI